VDAYDRVVVMTATVVPSFTVAVNQASIRVKQYESAIGFWQNQLTPDDQLIVVENSGVDLLQNYKRVDNGPSVRYVDASSTGELSITRGKGFAEAEMLQKLLPHLPAAESLYKVTGRLVVRNFSRIAWPMPYRGRWLQVRMRPTLDFADSRFFGADCETFGRLAANLPPMVDEEAGQWIEHALAREALSLIGSGAATMRRFQTSPQISGISGSTGTRLGGFGWRARRMMESSQRRSKRLNAALWV
jgi:hypothetical protein